MKSLQIIFLISIFVSKAFASGQHRDGGHPEGIKIKLKIEQVLEAAKAIISELPPGALEAINRIKESTAIYVICQNPEDYDPKFPTRCGLSEAIGENQMQPNQKIPVLAAMFHQAGDLYCVYHIWKDLSETDRLLVLAHEIFEMAGLETNNYKYSKILAAEFKKTAWMKSICESPSPIFSEDSTIFEDSLYAKTFAVAEEFFLKANFKIFPAGNISTEKINQKGLAGFVHGNHKLIFTFKMNKFYFPENWSGLLKLYVLSTDQRSYKLIWSQTISEHKDFKSILAVLAERNLPNCATIVGDFERPD